MLKLAIALSLTFQPGAVAAQGIDAIHLSGFLINTTNEQSPVQATLELSVTAGDGCIVKLGAPLFGSGVCEVKRFDPSGALDFVSIGPIFQIAWKGAKKDGHIVGEYSALNSAQPSLSEHGVFQLDSVEGEPASLGQTIRSWPIQIGSAQMMAVREHNMVSLHDTEGRYTGDRLVVDDMGNPILAITDYKDGSRIVDASSGSVLAEWVTRGPDGYHVMRVDGVTYYFDRFFNRLPWSSVQKADGQPLMVKQVDDTLELFDQSLQPLNIRNDKTASGRRYWTKTDGDVTTFLNEKLQPLNWYSIQRDGRQMYATYDQKGKPRYFDGDLREIKRKTSFWKIVGIGLLVGLAAYGEALQAQAAALPPPMVIPSPDWNYASILPLRNRVASTSTIVANRMGGLTFSNTYTTNGSLSMMNQRIGTMDFFNGMWTNGGTVNGTAQHIGSSSFFNFRAGSAFWSGTGQRVGNFTFYNFSSATGGMRTGFSQRIGDFIFTTIH